ncbi:MAG: thiamine diphosphokinase [Anaerolineales bacterium]|nr:thiamine diphosphokinase [Anaerolineales bacterium]
MPTRILIFANGTLSDPAPVRRLLRTGDLLLAADGGMGHAQALGLVPQAIIGDLDSLTPGQRRWAEANGIHLQVHPEDKNESDLELAFRAALEQGPEEIIVVAALGGRLDQTLANLALLNDPALAGLDVRLDDGVEQAFFIEAGGRREVRGAAGDLVSLLPWGGPAAGVRTVGLRWPLQDEILLAYRTRGLSNELLGGTATVEIRSGLLLVIHRRMS